jgi:hypothetical protein
VADLPAFFPVDFPALDFWTFSFGLADGGLPLSSEFFGRLPKFQG